jgi:hypothetical protein
MQIALRKAGRTGGDDAAFGAAHMVDGIPETESKKASHRSDFAVTSDLAADGGSEPMICSVA